MMWQSPMNIHEPEGATPLSPEMLDGLIPGLTTQQELNEFEQLNIASAMRWAKRSRKLHKELVSMEALRFLHRKMLEDVWSWAGQFRVKDTNIGVAWHQIPEQLLKLCANVTYWQENKTWSPDEIAVRFHHKLVQIHPFPNGNGRHARLVADLMVQHEGRAPFSWGRHAIGVSGETRDTYLKALRLADRHQIERLLEFARG